MTPSKPYVVRAIYDWIVDNNCTPHVLIDAASDGVVVPEDYVTEGQIVLSGKNIDLGKLIDVLKLKNIKNIKLPVSAPFHCSLMSNATKIMKEEINKLNFKKSQNKLISNVTAEEISSIEDLKNLLIKQIENRVRWRESVINMIKNDINHFIEIGPGKVLSGLVKRINRDVMINTINNQEDIEKLKI